MSPVAPRKPVPRSTHDTRLLAWGLALLCVAAFIARVISLSSQPGGLYPDEAAEGDSALAILEHPGYHPVFFNEDGGREALFGYMVAAVFRIAGASVTTLRGTSALLGVAMVPMTYLALRRLGDGVAFTASAWTAGTLWLVAISRDGMRNALVPVTTALVMWMLLRWASAPSRGRAIVAGVAMGAGLWTYQPLKLLPILVVLWMLWMRGTDPARYARMRPHLGWTAAGYILVALPVIAVAIVNPVAYFGRGVQTSPLNPEHRNGIGIVHLLRVLGMFSVAGDPNPRHDAGALPLLGWPLGVIALGGVLRAWRWRRSEHAASLLLIGGVLFLMPPLIAVEGDSPHFLRSLALAPFLAGFIGLGCAELTDQFGKMVQGRLARPLALTVCGGVLSITVSTGLSAYFTRSPSQWWYAYSTDIVQMSRMADPRDIVIANEYDAMTVTFIDHAHLPSIARPSEAANPAPGTTVYATNPDDLRAVLGHGLAASIQVVASDPDGHPDVYAVRR